MTTYPTQPVIYACYDQDDVPARSALIDPVAVVQDVSEVFSWAQASVPPAGYRMTWDVQDAGGGAMLEGDAAAVFGGTGCFPELCRFHIQ